jgi:hypothetical protein
MIPRKPAPRLMRGGRLRKIHGPTINHATDLGPLRIRTRRVGRAARHRGANATRPKGRAGSTPALSATSVSRTKFCPRSPIGRGPGLNPGQCGFDARRGYARVAQRQRQRLQIPPSGRSNRPSRTKQIAPFAKRPKASVLHTDIPGFKSSTEHHPSHVSRKSDGGGR